MSVVNERSRKGPFFPAISSENSVLHVEGTYSVVIGSDNETSLGKGTGPKIWD